MFPKLRLAIVAGLFVSVPAALAPANAVVTVAVPGSFAAGYATPEAYAMVGGPLLFVNTDIQDHNVIAKDATRANGSRTWCSGYLSGRCPLFWSETIGAGGYTMVQGLEQATSGRVYKFFCSVHPGMVGNLHIL